VATQAGDRGAGQLAFIVAAELVTERAARCALHDGLVTGESDFAAASRCNVEIGLAYQQRAEFRLAECAKELCISAMRYVEFKRFLIMAAHLHRNILLGNFGDGGVHGRPLAARATINAVADGRKQLFRPAAQGLLNDSVGLRFPEF